ncbi:MAG: mechanosensitive ion channel [Desulfuromonadales bacterium]|nr:mechanosensitive ion channel [Desulfuromonadales bacterium]
MNVELEDQLAMLQGVIDRIIEFSVNYSFQVVGALIILVIGFAAGRWVAGLVGKLCQKKNLDVTLSQFLASFVKLLILLFAVIIALGKFGITIAPFIAAIGAVAFGATYAIQGPLSNYGAGLVIIVGRSFLVGDTISVAGVFGVVREIRLGQTFLETEDRVTITIPNKLIVGEILQNSRQYRIVEGCVGISYSDNPETAIRILNETLAEIPAVTSEPPPQVGIEAFADSSVAIGYRYWVPTHQYFQTLHCVNLAVFKALKSAEITIPFPQREIKVTRA